MGGAFLGFLGFSLPFLPFTSGPGFFSPEEAGRVMALGMTGGGAFFAPGFLPDILFTSQAVSNNPSVNYAIIMLWSAIHSQLIPIMLTMHLDNYAALQGFVQRGGKHTCTVNMTAYNSYHRTVDMFAASKQIAHTVMND